jgi:hypothetical protein
MTSTTTGITTMAPRDNVNQKETIVGISKKHVEELRTIYEI